MSTVYFIKLDGIENIRRLLPSFPKPLALKVHFGEKGNTTFLPAPYIKRIAAMAPGSVMVETSVLYRSLRSKASTHRALAIEHGFDFLPIDFLDGAEGDDALEITIKGEHFKTGFLGKGLEKYQSLLTVSHFKGHYPAGFGGALKNIGMGLASRRGKLALHASIQHQVDENLCIACGTCLASCPTQAIAYRQNAKALIDINKCISCSKCISVCPTGAIDVPWDRQGGKALQERIAEYALATVQNRSCFFVNFLANITKNCDCDGHEMEKLTPDIGILASSDPVAVDQASFDMVVRQYPDFAKFDGRQQLRHAEKIGLGERAYNLVNI